jgi:hypothetical protein
MKFSNLNQLTRADKISTYLPYISYDPDRGIYFNRDDTAGFILEISPTPFAGENAITAISSVLDASWPKHTLAQFILYADPNMSGCWIVTNIFVDGAGNFKTKPDAFYAIGQPGTAIILWTIGSKVFPQKSRCRSEISDLL